MTCRSTSLLGLIVALVIVCGQFPAADASAQTSDQSSGDELLPDIALRPSVRAAQKSSTAWQKSGPKQSADVRFQKPDIAAVKYPPPTAADPSSFYPRIEPVEPPRLVIRRSPSARIDDRLESIPENTQIQKPKRQLARESTARLQELIEVPKAPKVTTLRKPNQAIDDGPIDDDLGEKRSETRQTDEDLQLVAQMNQASQVDFVADDEPLPGVSDESRLPRRPPADLADVNMIDECGSPQLRWSWVAGVEATFLNPDLNGDGATWLVEDAATGRDALFASHDNEVDSIYLSPRIWLGVQGEAWGANLRYWHLNASEYFVDPSVGSTGAWDDFDAGIPDVGLFSMSRLEAYTIDLELTRRFCLGDCSIQSSVGVRHAEIDHAESLSGTALVSGTSLFGFAAAERQARGTGIVFGWYGRKPIAPCSSIHWYYNLRWSALWGPTQTVAEAGAGSPTSGVNASTTSATTNLDDELYIGEVQLGLEWNRAVECLPAQAFLRAGVEYQRWTGGVGYSQSSALAGNGLFTSTGTTLASASAPELDFIGITLGAGLTW